MIGLEDLITKLSSLSPSRLTSSAYQRFKSIELKEIESALDTIAKLERGYTRKTSGAVKLLFLLDYSNEVYWMSANGCCSDVSPMSDQEIGEQAERMWAANYAPVIGDLESVVKRYGMVGRVRNADRYPDAEWLEFVKPIGSVGGSLMFLVGWEVPNSNEYPLVAVDRGGQLFAMPLWELQKHSQDKIEITDSL